MDGLIYIFARGFIALLQSLPLTCVARLGRMAGALAYLVDARHRRVVLGNLTMCFGNEKSPEEIRAIAKENFRCTGENLASAIKTASMSAEQLRPHAEFVGADRLVPMRRVVVAVGHFGNFELFPRFKDIVPGYQCATTYRAMKQPGLNKLMQSLRERSGCLFFERRTGGAQLRAAMNQPAIILGLLADQHGGWNGLRLPFLGNDCSTSPAPAVFALRYDCELYAAFCYRTGLARWQLELGEKIPTHENGHPRPTLEIMRDVNRAFEIAVRRDPTNWFWMHRRWKIDGLRPSGANQKPEIESGETAA